MPNFPVLRSRLFSQRTDQCVDDLVRAPGYRAHSAFGRGTAHPCNFLRYTRVAIPIQEKLAVTQSTELIDELILYDRYFRTIPGMVVMALNFAMLQQVMRPERPIQQQRMTAPLLTGAPPHLACESALGVRFGCGYLAEFVLLEGGLRKRSSGLAVQLTS